MHVHAVRLPQFLFRLFAALCVLWTGSAAVAQVPSSSHVIIVIEENRSYSTVTNPNGGSNYMPWLVGEGTTYGHATSYFTDSSGSLLDYLWLSSGSCHSDPATTNCNPSKLPANTNSYGCTGGGCANTILDNNIFREMIANGISWKLYAESIPSVGFMGTQSSDGLYVKRHNPAAWYSDIVNSSAQQQKMVPFSQFATDMANNALPRYSIIIPNLNDDAHNGTPQQADNWLQTNVAPVLNQPFFQTGGDGLLIVTFDNGDGDAAGQVYTALIGPKVIRGTASATHYMHENALGTILTSLGLTGNANRPGASLGANDMTDFFSGTPPPPTGDLDDNTWTACSGCAAATNGIVSPALDAGSTRFDFTSTTPFATQKWTQALTNTFSSTPQLAYDFWAYVTDPTSPQALNFKADQIVSGLEYPFMMECDFKNTRLWRVWNPVSGGSWVNTSIGCSAFTANSWNHFVIHVERTTGNQLHYQDIVINGTTYTINLLENSISNNSANSMTVDVELVGDGTPHTYSLWVDQMRLMAVTPNIDDGSWTNCGSPICSPAVNNVASPALDGGSTQFTLGGSTPFATAIWTATPNNVSTSSTHFTLDFWAYMTAPASSQALNFAVDQVTGGSEYPFMVECDFKNTRFWQVWDPAAGGWQQTSIGCSQFTANSWNHFTFRFERTAANQLHYLDVVINNVTYNFNILKNPITNTASPSVIVKVELVGDNVPDSYSLWIDELSLADI